jgi:integrase/recombinase XerD
MASLYKKPIVRADAKTGKKIKTHSKKWWDQFRDATGQLRRHPLSSDKSAAQAMLNDLVRQVEREKVGLVDPTDAQRKRPLKEHFHEFKTYLQNKDVPDEQAAETTHQIEKIVVGSKRRFISDITAGDAMQFLADLRRKGRSIQTCNHYLKAVKQFTAWLVRDRRTLTDELAHVKRQNVATDRRHDRRALSHDEFTSLVAAAHNGRRVEGVSGPDRAMLYTLAAWTGFRKGELGSLTIRSLNLDGNPPTATVAASFSKRRREDTQVLHPDLVAQLKAWLATKPSLKPDEPLFPISGKVPGGTDRKTHKMIHRDLAAAREIWIDEASTDEGRAARVESDFLSYCDHSGRYADFHSLRHLFITRLEQAGISPKMAQTLARHSDIRLTLNVYTHVDLHDQTAAIQSLPGPSGACAEDVPANGLRVTG